MRLIVSFITILTISIYVSACTTTNNNDENREDLSEHSAIELAELFIEKMYTLSHDAVNVDEPYTIVEHQEMLSSYVTEDAYNDLKNKEIRYPLTVVEKEEVDLTVESIDIKDVQKNDTEYDMEFSFTVEKKDNEGNINEGKVKGEMTVEQIDQNRLEISRYYDRFERVN